MRNPARVVSGLALSLAALVACGGDDDVEADGSGLDGSQPVSSLSADERMRFCEWAIAEQGGAGTVHQCDTFTLTVQMCVDQFASVLTSCTATVAQAEACVDAVAAMPCGQATACAPLDACFPE